MKTRQLHTKHFTLLVGGSFNRFGLGIDANWSGRGKGGLASIDFLFWWIGIEW